MFFSLAIIVIKEDYVKMSKFNFSKPSVPVQKFDAFDKGRVIDAMPSLVASNMRFGNYRDLGKGRMPEYNSDENDRTLLYDNWFDLAGNPVFSDPLGSGEQVVVFDLEQSDLKEAKALVAGLNSKTNLNSSYSLDVSPDVYQLVKGSDGSFVIKPSLANDLRNNAYSHNTARSGFVRKLFQENNEEAKQYIDLVKDHHGVSNLNGIIGFFPGNFKGMRLLWGGSVGDEYSFIFTDYSLYYSSCLLGVGDGVASVGDATAQKTDYSTIVKPTLEQTIDVLNNPDLNREGMIRKVTELYNK